MESHCHQQNHANQQISSQSRFPGWKLPSNNGGESKRLNRFQEEEEEKKDLANPHQRSQEIRQDRGFHNPFKKPVNQIEQQHYRKVVTQVAHSMSPYLKYSSSSIFHIGRQEEYKQVIASITAEIDEESKKFVSHLQDPQYYDVSYLQNLVSKLERKITSNSKHFKNELKRVQHLFERSHEIDIFVMEKAHDQKVEEVREELKERWNQFLLKEERKFQAKVQENCRYIKQENEMLAKQAASQEARIFQLNAKVKELETSLKLEEATSAFNNLNLNGDKAKKRVYKEIKNDDFQSDEEEEDFPEYLPNYSQPLMWHCRNGKQQNSFNKGSLRG
eukprot:403351683